ncbi:MAG: Cys-tRNA(Pro) deacylase [Clostridia bacterium]|nr:Cys-tRNA(Pro) deacylase [Clostridia bacterium]
MIKTNAMRILDKEKIQYTPYEYPVDENNLTGVHIAEQIGLDPDIVFKTITAKGDKNGIVVFCIPCAFELDLKKCARVTGDKRIELIAVKDLLANTGYIRGGCSPIGMKKLYPTYIDESCLLWDKITVSAGARGCQLLLSATDLIKVVKGVTADLTV